jgi:hypothetical protein
METVSTSETAVNFYENYTLGSSYCWKNLQKGGVCI